MHKRYPRLWGVVEYAAEVIRVGIIALAIILPVRYFLIQPFYVKGASMEPNFHDHEYLIINEIGYRLTEPGRGDVVVFRYPADPSDFFIKRVIGLPGEKISVADGIIRIYNAANPQGFVLNEPYLDATVKTLGTRDAQLASDEYFVMGDNRENSLDSRIFGPLQKKFIVGRAWVRGWPFAKAGFIEQPLYTN